MADSSSQSQEESGGEGLDSPKTSLATGNLSWPGVVEVLGLGLLVAGVDLLAGGDPGFPSVLDLPYWLPPLLFAATLGRKYAALSLGVDFFLLAGIMPVIAALSGHPLRASWWGIRFVADGTLVSLIIVTAFFASAKLERDSRMIEGLRGRLRDRGSELHILRRATAALTSVNRNLEERLARNDEILTSLWQYSRSLYRLDTRQHFEEMADAIVRLVRVNKLTVLRLDDEKRQLVPVTVRGGATAIPLPLEESIEGWVARNKSLFSIRMLLNNQYLSSLDEGRSIMAFPIIVAGTPIAVLNIEDIDFVKYNAFTERLIAMLIHLGRDALEASVADERILGPDSIEATTGLARSDRIIAYLDYAIEQAHITSASLSFLIIELGNAALILERYPDLKPDELVKELARRAVGSLPDECRVFRADSGLGIAIVFPGKDRDGAAQFSLEMLGRVGSSGWKMGRDLVRVEPLIGIATLGVGIRSGAVLAGAAAGLLEQQRSRL